MRRRAVLATLGTGVFAGCSSINALGGQKFEKAPRGEAVSNVKELNLNDETAGGQSARVTLEKGQYLAAGFAWETPFTMEITGQVVENGPIDLYVMTTGQLNKFQREPNLINAAHEAPRVESLDVNTDMQSGQYHIVFDNTHLGDAEPSGTAEIDFSAEFIGQEPTPTPSQ
jgi:hypothetical protein